MLIKFLTLLNWAIRKNKIGVKWIPNFSYFCLNFLDENYEKNLIKHIYYLSKIQSFTRSFMSTVKQPESSLTGLNRSLSISDIYLRIVYQKAYRRMF